MPTPDLLPVLLALGASWGTTSLVLRTQRWHAHWSTDSTEGKQKFHTLPTPRVGGIGPWVGLLCAALWAQIMRTSAEAALLWALLLCGLPALLTGFAEDITKRVGVKWRLLATMGSGVLVWHFTGSLITRVDVWGFDAALQWLPFAVFFTAFAIGGLANAVNIIDGFNGLASGVVALTFATTAHVAAALGDADLASISAVMCAASVGFWLVNFPRGRIFMGDGGSYFLGFAAAWMVVILVARHPQLSPWFAFLCCGYPVIETLFSIWRKTLRRGYHPGQPDRVHFHMLVYARVAQPLSRRWGQPTWANPLAGLLCQGFALLPLGLTLALYDQSSQRLFAALMLCCAVYALVYRKLSRFRWL